jgi:hypothetical protein
MGCTAAALKDILFGMAFDVPPESIMMKILANGVIAQVRIEDPDFAKRLGEKSNQILGNLSHGELNIRPIQVGSSHGTAVTNPLQMSTVIC